jgi:hypothetical protein
MFVSVRRLVERWRQPRSRRDEVDHLHARLREEAEAASPEERAIAAELRTLRIELGEAMGTIASCASCATGCEAPHGRWDGGFCCGGGETLGVFGDDEIAALAAAGTTYLPAPSDDHAGCAFRGSRGCTLTPADRPNLCVIFLCTDATREVHDRGGLGRIEEISERLNQRYRALARARSSRLFSPPL